MHIIYHQNAKDQTFCKEDTLLQPSIVIQKDHTYLYSVIMVHTESCFPYFINWMMVNISVNNGTFTELIAYYPPIIATKYKFILLKQSSSIKLKRIPRTNFSLQTWIHQHGLQVMDSCDMNVT